jgi:hypothetical protein
MWLEFVAYDSAGTVIFESGTIQDGEIEQLPNDERPNRKGLVMFRDHMLDRAGKEVHMFWEAQQPSKSELLLPARRLGDVFHYKDVTFTLPPGRKPARAVMRMRMRPMGLDVLQSLVDSGDLDPKILAKVPTFTTNNTYREWHAEDAPGVLRIPEASKSRDDACDERLRGGKAP